MTTMKPHSAVLLDETSHTSGSPQLRSEAVGHRSLEQKLDDLATLSIRQGARATGGELHLQGIRSAALAGVPPAHHRARRDIEHATDLVDQKPFLQQAQSLMAARFDDLSRTLGSRHGCAPIAAPRPSLHYLCDSRQWES